MNLYLCKTCGFWLDVSLSEMLVKALSMTPQPPHCSCSGHGVMHLIQTTDRLSLLHVPVPGMRMPNEHATQPLEPDVVVRDLERATLQKMADEYAENARSCRISADNSPDMDRAARFMMTASRYEAQADSVHKTAEYFGIQLASKEDQE